jgi:hypothetical protein
MPHTDHETLARDRTRDREQVETSEAAGRVRAEVEAIHEFFVGWFHGALEDDDDLFLRDFARRLDPGFVLVTPSGEALPLARLIKLVRGAHGSNPEFEIEIRDVRLRHQSGDIFVATYEEWQRHAKHNTPANNRRISTVVLRADRVAPGGLAWLHLHETALASEDSDSA